MQIVRLIILSLFATLVVPVCFAQLPSGNLPGVRLEVKNVASGKSTGSYSWADGYGSYWKNFVRSTRLEAEVGTFSANLLDLKLQWFFVGKQLATNRRVLISKGEQPIKLKNGPAAKIVLASEPVNSQEVRYAFYGGRYASGARPEGWVVRVVNDAGTQFAIRTSPANLADVFKDPAQVEALLKTADDRN
jgi:hypothetical protein